MFSITDKVVINLISSIEELPGQYFWLRTSDFKQQLYISDSFQKIWDRPIEQLYEHSTAFRDALVKEDDRIIQLYHQRAHSSNPDVPNDTILSRLNTPHNDVQHLRDTCFALYDSYGNVVGMGGIGKVITASEWEYDLQGKVKEKHPISGIIQQLRKKHIETSEYINQNEVTIPCKQIGNKYHIHTVKGEVALTKRELECSQYLLAGKTAKETAKFLGISHRTVEEYLDQVRIKLGCRNKIEIIKFIKLVAQGYFDLGINTALNINNDI